MGNFFVRRPIVAMVIAIVTVIVGVVFMGGLPIEQYPNITPRSKYRQHPRRNKIQGYSYRIG